MMLKPTLQVKIYRHALEIVALEIASGDEKKAKDFIDKWAAQAIAKLREEGEM